MPVPAVRASGRHAEVHATACKRLFSAGGVLTPLVLCCRHADFIDEIIAALEESVAEALATPEPEGMKSGVAIYATLNSALFSRF